MNKKSILAMVLVSLLMSGCGNSVQSSTEQVEPVASEQITETVPATTEPHIEASVNLQTGTYEDGSSPTFSEQRIRMVIDNQEVVIRMYDNEASSLFLERRPLDNQSFTELNGVEKYASRPEIAFSTGDETQGYDLVPGDMVIYRPWGNYTIFYGDYDNSADLYPLGHVESRLEIIEGQTEDFTGSIELVEE